MCCSECSIHEAFADSFAPAQGKYINDKGVLLEAAKAAGVTDAEAVVEDETIEAKEASFPSSFYFAAAYAPL